MPGQGNQLWRLQIANEKQHTQAKTHMKRINIQHDEPKSSHS